MKKVLTVLMVLSWMTPAEAAYLDLAWNANTEPDLAGYQVYYGSGSGAYSHSVDVGDTTTYRLEGLTAGATYYVSVTAYDTAGNESGYSNEVSGVAVPESGSDSDTDGLPDDWEWSYFGSLDYGPGGDGDGDGATNLVEYQSGTDPTDGDTDSDQMPDGWEIMYGLDPCDASDAGDDSDGDGLTNLEEYLAGSDPTNRPPPMRDRIRA
ncbi:MAG: fibronectin type III domain-containing protein [Deltaproteobacteria bacterium]|nr:fibronectin type III domain-containing protein [Deltaproteobacteria bacterium]